MELEGKLTLRSARVLRGISQEQMAKLLEVSTPTYCMWENGRHSMPAGKFILFGSIVGISLDLISL